MPGTNTYKDTEAADYIDAIRKHQSQNRSANSSARNFTPTHVLQRINTVNFSNSFTNTQKTLGDYDVVDNTSKLVAYYPFDYEVTDAINANDATVSPGGSESYVDGPELGDHGQRKAFDFNGSTYLTLDGDSENNFDLDYNAAQSYSFWFKTSTSGVQYLYTKWASGVGRTINLNAAESLVFVLQNTNTTNELNVRTTTTGLDDGHWHHVVFTKSTASTASGMNCLLDGTAETLVTVTDTLSATVANASDAEIGTLNAGTSTFTGQIDDFQIWNVELNSDERTELWHGKQVNKDTAATNPAIIGLCDIA